MKVEVPRKDVIQGLHYPLTWSNEFCGGKGKRGAMVWKGKGPWDDVQIKFEWLYLFSGEEKMKTREDKKNGQTWVFPKVTFLDTY